MKLVVSTTRIQRQSMQHNATDSNAVPWMTICVLAVAVLTLARKLVDTGVTNANMAAMEQENFMVDWIVVDDEKKSKVGVPVFFFLIAWSESCELLVFSSLSSKRDNGLVWILVLFGVCSGTWCSPLLFI